MCHYSREIVGTLRAFGVLGMSFSCVGLAKSGGAHLEGFAKRDFFALR